MCFICNCVTVTGSVEQSINPRTKAATGMPNHTANTGENWASPWKGDESYDVGDDSDATLNTDIWYDAIDDLSLLKHKDFNIWPVADQQKPQMSDLEDSYDNLQFFDAVDKISPADMKANSSQVSEVSTPSKREGASPVETTSVQNDTNCRISSETNMDWDDGFEFYLWANGDCEESDSDCESVDDDYEEENFSEDEDEDNDFIIFDDTERTVGFTSCSPKSSYKCTSSKPKKHVHFSPKLVTVYAVTLGEEECRKGPWIQFAVDRMHFHHRIEQLEQVLTPCLLLKQKLGHQFLETMNNSKFTTNKAVAV